jgi:hypothetical protein
MVNPFQGFAKRLLSTSMVGELLGLLPEPAREALADVRDYLAEHGHWPKLEPLRRAPLGAGTVQAVSVFLGALGTGERLTMVNLVKGVLEGGHLRATNVMLGDVHGGRAEGLNALIGTVHGGSVERVNLLVGDVHGGELRVVNVLVGDVHGGVVQCHTLIGDVHGGQVDARNMHGKVHGGIARVGREL